MNEAEEFGFEGNSKLLYIYRMTLKDNELHVALLKQAQEYDMAINNLKWKLSHLTQRYVLEKFYQKFWTKLNDNKAIKKDQKVRIFWFLLIYILHICTTFYLENYDKH